MGEGAVTVPPGDTPTPGERDTSLGVPGSGDGTRHDGDLDETLAILSDPDAMAALAEAHAELAAKRSCREVGGWVDSDGERGIEFACGAVVYVMAGGASVAAIRAAHVCVPPSFTNPVAWDFVVRVRHLLNTAWELADLDPEGVARYCDDEDRQRIADFAAALTRLSAEVAAAVK